MAALEEQSALGINQVGSQEAAFDIFGERHFDAGSRFLVDDGAFFRAAIVFGHNLVLGDIEETAREITGLGGV